MSIKFLKDGMNTSDATATADDILNPKIAYGNNGKIIGDILTEDIPSGLSISNESAISSTNNYILDYSSNYDIAMSASSANNITNLSLNNNVLNKDINISQIINSNTTLLAAKFSGVVIGNELKMLAILHNNETNTNNFAVITINVKTLDIVNVYIDNTIELPNKNSYYNIIYNKVKDCFAVLFKNNVDNQDVSIYIVSCDEMTVTQLYKRTDSTYSFMSGTTINLLDGYWSPDGEKLLLHTHYLKWANNNYITNVFLFTKDMREATKLNLAGNTIANFLNNNYLIDSSNNIYIINENAIELDKNVENISITSKSVNDKIMILDNTFYLYFSVTSQKIMIYKFDVNFNFSFVEEKDWNVNSTNISYPYLLFCPSKDDKQIKYSEPNLIKYFYTTYNNPHFASLSRKNIKYYNTSDSDINNADLLKEKVAYTKDGRVVGTMTDNGDVIITPTTDQQIKTNGYYNSLKIEAVDNSIDSNIVAENIKEGVSILGITGTLEEGIDTSDADATASDISNGKTAYVNGEKITGNLPLFPNTRTFTVDGGVTDDKENSKLKVSTINATKQIIDSNLNMEFSASYTNVAETVGLTPEKITKGQTILGIEGNAETGIDTSDATATVNDIAQDKTAYVNGEKITGTLKKLFELSYIVNNVVWTDETDLDQLRLDIPLLGDGIVTSNQTKTVVILHYDKLAEEIGLTADKIKAGETILGITGTYTGETVES